MTNQFSAESKQICHQVGMHSLLPVVQRLLDAETAVQQLSLRIAELEKRMNDGSAPHLRNVEKREV